MGSRPDIPAISCAENIALLSLLHSVSSTSPLQVIPTAPSSKTPVDISDTREYELPVDKEQSLVRTLSFLAQTEEDPNHIPAICVEQDIDSLNVLIAVNKSKWSDGDSILHTLEAKFNMIFAMLKTVLEQDPSAVEEALFAAIVDMCSLRILHRLRLKPSKKQARKSKKPMKEILQHVTIYVKQVAAEPGTSETLRATALLFRDRARDVTSLIDSWQGHQTAARLGDLVRGIHHLHQTNQLTDLLNQIPASEMQSEAKKSFLNGIGKISRYYDAPKVLRQIARKFRVARNMIAIPVKLSRDAFCKPSTGTYIPELLTSIARIDHQYSDPKKLSRVYHLLGYTETKSASLFSGQVDRTLREAKIHAEIQIIIYCELQGCRLFPRVVCSSKDACFLCNAFISLHKQIHTPRCHGRLYPGWRLPSLPQVKELEDRFNKTLEQAIKESLSMLFSRQRKTTYPPPNESTLLTIPISETTKSSLVQHGSGQMSCENNDQLLSYMADKPHKEPASENSSCTSIPFGTACAENTIDLGVSSAPDGWDSDSKVIGSRILLQGMIVHDSIDPGGGSANYIADPMRLTIEYETGLERINYSIKWLTAEELRELQSSTRPPLCVGVESLANEFSIRDQSSVCILVKGTALRLSWEPKST